MKKIQFSCIIDGVSKKKDGTLTIKLGSQELPPEETSHIFEMGNKQIFAVFADTEIKADELDIPESAPEFKNDKSSAQRLRSVIFVYWNTKTGKEKTFDEFYKSYIEKIIENIKDKLD